MSNDTSPRPIDEEPAIPAPAGSNTEYLTRDLEIALEAEVQALLDLEQRAGGTSRRTAVLRLITRFQALRSLITP